MKKILSLLVTLFCLFLIYQAFDAKKINYVSIGDSFMKGYNDYVYKYLKTKNRVKSYNDMFYHKTIVELKENIQKNQTIRVDNKDYFIKKVLRESDYLIISVGMEELIKKYNPYDMNSNQIFFDKQYFEIEKLIVEVKKYAKDHIIFIGFYNPTKYYDSKTDEFFYNIDITLNELMQDNDITYIDLYEIVKEHEFKSNNNSSFLNQNGYQKVANIIEYYLD